MVKKNLIIKLNFESVLIFFSKYKTWIYFVIGTIAGGLFIFIILDFFDSLPTWILPDDSDDDDDDDNDNPDNVEVPKSSGKRSHALNKKSIAKSIISFIFLSTPWWFIYQILVGVFGFCANTPNVFVFALKTLIYGTPWGSWTLILPTNPTVHSNPTYILGGLPNINTVTFILLSLFALYLFNFT